MKPHDIMSSWKIHLGTLPCRRRIGLLMSARDVMNMFRRIEQPTYVFALCSMLVPCAPVVVCSAHEPICVRANMLNLYVGVFCQYCQLLFHIDVVVKSILGTTSLSLFICLSCRSHPDDPLCWRCVYVQCDHAKPTSMPRPWAYSSTTLVPIIHHQTQGKCTLLRLTTFVTLLQVLDIETEHRNGCT